MPTMKLVRPCVLVYDCFGEFAPLSNDFLCSFSISGVLWPSVEHYYQASKFLNEQDRDLVRRCSSGQESRELAWGALDSRVRHDWDDVRLFIMKFALEAKFSQCEVARRNLISTWPFPIAEDSPTDDFWGIGPLGLGKNMLGSLLEEVRAAHFDLSASPIKVTFGPSTRISQPLSIASRIEAVACFSFFVQRCTIPAQESGVLNSALTLQSIDVMMAQALRELGLVLPSAFFNRFSSSTLGDLRNSLTSAGSFGTEKQVTAALGRARCEAFDQKYGGYKWCSDARSAIPKWTETFLNWFSLKIPFGLTKPKGIVVGAGAGEEAEHVWSRFEGELVLVDIGATLAENCRLQCPSAAVVCASAEDLSALASDTFTFYCSLRTYQSLLLDRIAALSEARRVLMLGGLLVISVADAYMREDGNLQRGQISGNNIEMTAAIAEICEIADAACALGFSSIGYHSFETELVLFAYRGAAPKYLNISDV